MELGRARAAALGWPDAYAYTKALGERALAETRGDVPVSIVRPSIIESALAEPYPGWIRGFRMAEPVIISYARGLLKEFPGLPEGVVDVIPVDFVVAAALAVAAGDATGGAGRLPGRHRQPEPVEVPARSSTWCRTGSRPGPSTTTPASRSWCPNWSFPGRGKVRRQLNRAVKGISAAEKAVGHLPVRGAQADVAARWRSAAPRPSGPSATWSSTAPTWRPRPASTTGGWRRCGTRLTDADRAAFCFDPRTIDWAAYVRDVHLPSIVHHARVRTKPGTRRAA